MASRSHCVAIEELGRGEAPHCLGRRPLVDAARGVGDGKRAQIPVAAELGPLHCPRLGGGHLDADGEPRNAVVFSNPCELGGAWQGVAAREASATLEAQPRGPIVRQANRHVVGRAGPRSCVGKAARRRRRCDCRKLRRGPGRGSRHGRNRRSKPRPIAHEAIGVFLQVLRVEAVELPMQPARCPTAGPDTNRTQVVLQALLVDVKVWRINDQPAAIKADPRQQQAFVPEAFRGVVIHEDALALLGIAVSMSMPG